MLVGKISEKKIGEKPTKGWLKDGWNNILREAAPCPPHPAGDSPRQKEF